MTPTPPTFDASFQGDFMTLLRWRRDVRHFDARPVPEVDMQAILHSAAYAPSVGNAQPWRFVRLRSPAIREALVAHVDAEVARAGERYAGSARHRQYRALKLHGLGEAPELLAVYCDEDAEAGHGLGIATMPETLRYSCVMALHTLWLTARTRGIGMGWVSILDPEYLASLLEVPARWSLIALLCIGYPTAPADAPELETRGWQASEPISARIFER